MSYLAFHSRSGTVHLCGPEVHRISKLALDALTVELARPGNRQLCRELGLPAPGSQFFESQILWLMSDGETHRVQGEDLYLFDVALTILYEHTPAAGILCWLFDNALRHGWLASEDREAMASEIQAALDAGVARPRMADRHMGALEAGGHVLPAGTRGGWEEVITFLAGGTGDVVTSISVGDTFPNWELAFRAGTWCPALRAADGHEDELSELWEQLSDGDQWDLCMRALQARPARQWLPGGKRYAFADFTIRAGSGVVPGDGLARQAP